MAGVCQAYGRRIWRIVSAAYGLSYYRVLLRIQRIGSVVQVYEQCVYGAYDAYWGVCVRMEGVSGVSYRMARRRGHTAGLSAGSAQYVLPGAPAGSRGSPWASAGLPALEVVHQHRPGPMSPQSCGLGSRQRAGRGRMVVCLRIFKRMDVYCAYGRRMAFVLTFLYFCV